MEAFDARYIPNTFITLLTPPDPKSLLLGALETILTSFPPRETYEDDTDKCKGLWSGPTALAYLFLQVDTTNPELVISGRSARQWATEYLGGRRQLLAPPDLAGSKRCGIGSETLCYIALRAALDPSDAVPAAELATYVPAVLGSHAFPDELLQGRAGLLYLLRLVRSWSPQSAAVLQDGIEKITEEMLAKGPEWTWLGRRYLGAVHGDIGILTQLVLTTPAVAPRVETWLEAVLDWQQIGEAPGQVEGNWPTRPRREPHGTDLIQFCHGATGVLASLPSLKSHFPRLNNKIDKAMRFGQQCVWKYGLLKKEPSLCHGMLGNALVLPVGDRRSHLLGMSAPGNVQEMKAKDAAIFKPADYGSGCGALTSYSTSLAWACLVQQNEAPKFIAYNDI